MSVFAAVKDHVDIVHAAQRYGVAVDKRNKAICPFHHDTNPSLSFKDDRFTCFSCGESGDVIDLVGHLIRAGSPLETVRELNRSYHLGMNLDGPPDHNALRNVRRRQLERELFARWEQEACNLYARYLHRLREWKERYAPVSIETPLHPLFLEACAKLEHIQHICDSVFRGSMEDKKRFYLSHREEVERLGQRLDHQIEPYHIYQ